MFLGDRYRADFAGPRIDVAEHVTMDSLKVVEVVVAGDRASGQLGEPYTGSEGLLEGELGRGVKCLGNNSETVSQEA